MTKQLARKICNYEFANHEDEATARERVCDLGALIEELTAKKWSYLSLYLGDNWTNNENPDLMGVEKMMIRHKAELEGALAEAYGIFRTKK